MSYNPDPAPGLGTGSNGFGWRWKPVDIVVLVIAFAIHWVLGLTVLVWKLWNDRQPVPHDLGEILQTGATRVQAAVENLFSTVSQATSADQPTGNAAFDAHVRAERARIAADSRRLDEEIAAFRAFLQSERAGDTDTYERFKQRRRG